jgi:hypothetical protein
MLYAWVAPIAYFMPPHHIERGQLEREGPKMSATTQSSRAASTRRMALAGLGAFIVLVLGGALVLWVQLGTAVFFELIAAGIRYCF